MFSFRAYIIHYTPPPYTYLWARIKGVNEGGEEGETIKVMVYNLLSVFKHLFEAPLLKAEFQLRFMVRLNFKLIFWSGSNITSEY